ncbi:NMT1/THI5 like domain-containing protein [Desulfonema limicola]|uniref:Thiamine pyrimidine synthase n=1 Tax=Desulfonema limicola TaxID=45656 RepID=A0A975B9R7_9BACT|nr:ABC transporter substrate-binding protein [Desulfonema limicola]QTA81541.1 NMT1/THI5 like domain-containing protein [Desulfonema limicola]
MCKKFFPACFVFIFTIATLFSANGVCAEDTVNYRLKWLFNTSTVGDLYADVNGIFKAAGLDVKVKAGGPERDAIRELELNHAQFGTASADQVIRALSKGSPVVVVAQLFQVNPLQWIYRKSKPPVKNLEDLKGRVLGITYGGNDETIMKTLLAKTNIPDNEVKFFSVRYDYTPFFQDRVDLWPVYRNAQGPIIAQKLETAGEEVEFFNPADFGVKFVANSIVTSEKMLNQNPELVKRFTSALIQGWTEALDPANKQKALAVLEQFDKDTPPEIRKKQLEITRTFIKPSPGFKIGTIDIQGWKQTEEIMLAQKQIPGPVNVEQVLKGQE